MKKRQSVNIRTHFILQLLLMAMSLMVFGTEEAVFRFSYQRYWWALFFYLSQNILCYANIYLLVPKYLYERRFGRYILGCFAFAVIAFIMLCIISQSLSGSSYDGAPIWLIVLNSISSIITMAVIIASSTSLVLFIDWQEERKRISQLEEESVKAELSILKEQINPHFLFNTLNNVNVLLKKDAEEASRILFKLEELLRYQLKDNRDESVSLQSDIDFLDNYLRLEKIRRDHFDYRITLDGDIKQMTLPPLLFITFVENAVKHNVYGEGKAYVDITFHAHGDTLLFICNNSKADKTVTDKNEATCASCSGLGLKNIQRRLVLLYPDKHQLTIDDQGKIFSVKLKITLD